MDKEKLPAMFGITVAGFLSVGVAILAGLNAEVWLPGLVVLAGTALAVLARRDD